MKSLFAPSLTFTQYRRHTSVCSQRCSSSLHRPCRCRLCHRNLLCDCSSLSGGDRPQGHPWPSRLTSTVGDYLGHPHSVLHSVWCFLLRRRCQKQATGCRSFPYSLGHSSHPWCHTVRRSLLLSPLSSLACVKGSLGRGAPSPCQSSRRWQSQRPKGSG